jgi:CheY-like chemotaxis protein
VTSAGTGKGTEVTIHLPVAAITDMPAVPTNVTPDTTGCTLRVLIVEDNVDAAEMLGYAVSALGHTTRVAHDGAAALSAADDFAPDVIFLDIGLPVMNGYDVARTLRSRPAMDHVRIVAVTGWGQEEDRRKAREAGCNSHFTKPLSPAMLEQLLTEVARSTKQSTADGLST